MNDFAFVCKEINQTVSLSKAPHDVKIERLRLPILEFEWNLFLSKQMTLFSNILNFSNTPTKQANGNQKHKLQKSIGFQLYAAINPNNQTTKDRGVLSS